jgi:single-strand DNA-binding protein
VASDLDSISLTGRLTRDPELRHTGGGTAVCNIRFAWTTRNKDASGEWADKSNFIDVIVFGGRAETCAQYLGKGDRMGVSGRLEYREWDAKDGSGKRHTYEVVADNVVFLSTPRSRDEDWSGENAGRDFTPAHEQPDFAPATASTTSTPFGGDTPDEDIPFLFVDEHQPFGYGRVRVDPFRTWASKVV